MNGGKGEELALGAAGLGGGGGVLPPSSLLHESTFRCQSP